MDDYDMRNEIHNINVIFRGPIANKANKKEHQQTGCGAAEYARNGNKLLVKQDHRQASPEHNMAWSCAELTDPHFRKYLCIVLYGKSEPNEKHATSH